MSAEPIKFLLVDDTEENLIALEALLRRDGLELLRANSGSEALELMLMHDVSLAFLDVQMPEMDGFQLAELMRGAERTKHIPIIFVTAGSRDPTRVFKGYENGAVDFLFKPIEPHILKSKAEVFFELSRQRQELSEALRLNEMFVGILGHDLRNPLSALMSGTQLLEKQSEDVHIQRTVARMKSSGKRMADMIDQLLDLTRARLGGGLGFARQRKRVEVAQCVQRTVEELRQAHPDVDISFEQVGDSVTLGDGDRLLQLFSNMVGNAIQHGKKGRVAVRVGGDDKQITVRMQNSGTIPPDILPSIFDPFRGRRNPGSRGLGLGLYIAHQIALAHGGDISVVSNEEGTAFTVSLPRRSSALSGQAGPNKNTVLIVDDDESIRESLKEAFEYEGYVAHTAADGKSALQQLTSDVTFDVVILDLVLPVMDGRRVYQTMQADARLSKIPVIISTGTPQRAPADVVVVQKPLKLDKLLEVVASLFLGSQRFS